MKMLRIHHRFREKPRKSYDERQCRQSILKFMNSKAILCRTWCSNSSLLVVTELSNEEKSHSISRNEDKTHSEKCQDVRSTPGNSCSLKKWISIFWTWCCICQPLTGGDRYAPFTNEMSEEILNQPPLQQQTAINASSSSSDSRFHSCIPSSCSRPMNLLKYDRVNPSDTIDTTGTGTKTTTCTNPVNKACSSPASLSATPTNCCSPQELPSTH